MNTRYLTTLLLIPALLAQANAAEPKLPRDGWTSWQLASVDNAPAWCCWSNWREGNGAPVACPLDREDGFGVGDRDSTTDTVKVYARTTGGKIDRLQVLAASCPVDTKAPVHELADVSVDDSARWLVARVKEDGADSQKHRSLGEHALAALAMHPGEVASGALKSFTRDARVETRKSSVFWLSMLRGNEGADVTSSVMFNDQDSEVRKHAAFALAQTKSPRAATDLIRLGNTDKVGDVRAQAWFWLAQTGAANAEQAIVAGLRKDADAQVREQAVFALSQLPGDRAAKALIEVAQDQSLSREQRKRAVFWLSQSESDAAQAYLEKVLVRNID
jgi:HEAT repeat protein